MPVVAFIGKVSIAFAEKVVMSPMGKACHVGPDVPPFSVTEGSRVRG